MTSGAKAQTGSSSSSGGITALTGDVTASGTGSVNATVDALQGIAISSTAPTSGQVLEYNGTSWAPTALSSGITALTGDVTASGTGSVRATVDALQGIAISSTAPTSGQVLEYNGTSWAPTSFAASPGASIPSAAYVWNGSTLVSITPSNNVFLTGVYTLTTSNAQIAYVTLPAGTWLFNVSLLAGSIASTGSTVDAWLTTSSSSPTTSVLSSTSAQVANLAGNSKFQTMAFTAVITVASSTTVYLYAVGSSTNPEINNTAVNSVVNASGFTVVRIA